MHHTEELPESPACGNKLGQKHSLDCFLELSHLLKQNTEGGLVSELCSLYEVAVRFHELVSVFVSC